MDTNSAAEGRPVEGRRPRRVRPYTLTGGRVRAAAELPLEAMVVTADAGWQGAGPEHQVILAACTEPRSVVEISTRLGTPLGVTRVLVADLLVAGAVSVHRPDQSEVPAHRDLSLLKDVLHGIESL